MLIQQKHHSLTQWMSHTHHESHTAESWKTQTVIWGILKYVNEFVWVLKRYHSLQTLPHRCLSVDILSTLPRGIPQCCAAEAGCLVTAWRAYSSDGYNQRVVSIFTSVNVILSVEKSADAEVRYTVVCEYKSKIWRYIVRTTWMYESVRKNHTRSICSHSSVCLILHGLLIWQIDVLVTPFLCVWACVCFPQRHGEVTHTSDSITRLPGLGVTPEVKKDLECALIQLFLSSPFSLLSLLLYLSLYLAQTLLCALYIVRKFPWAEREGGHRRRWLLCLSALPHNGWMA